MLQPAVADIGFAVDASSSLYSQGFQTEISFINKVIDAVGPVSKDGIRISVLVYSNMAKLQIRLRIFFAFFSPTINFKLSNFEKS